MPAFCAAFRSPFDPMKNANTASNHSLQSSAELASKYWWKFSSRKSNFPIHAQQPTVSRTKRWKRRHERRPWSHHRLCRFYVMCIRLICVWANRWRISNASAIKTERMASVMLIISRLRVGELQALKGSPSGQPTHREKEFSPSTFIST